MYLNSNQCQVFEDQVTGDLVCATLNTMWSNNEDYMVADVDATEWLNMAWEIAESEAENR